MKRPVEDTAPAQAATPPPVALDGASLTVAELARAARGGARVELTEAARARVAAAHQRLLALAASGRRIYGLNTGVGALERDDAAPVSPAERQRALLRSHAAGVGAPMRDDQVRAMIAARANALARGQSGVTPEALDALLDLLARGVTPVVPEAGSVGASDLAPLAHMALVLVGQGRARVGSREMPAAAALAAAGLGPIDLAGRDALALINGPAQSAAIGALAACDGRRLIHAAETAAALTLCAIGAPRDFLDPRLARAKNHPGQFASSMRARDLLDGAGPAAAASSGLLRAPLSTRYAPQVAGAARSALTFAESAVEAELNAGADNPILDADGFVSSNSATTGGQELAQALDLLCSSLTSLAVVSERRTAGLLDDRAGALPAFLRHPRARPGVDSGLMIAQYTAAALVAELRARGGAAGIQSIPTCAGVEDHVSMCALSARQAAWVVERAETVIAIEILCASQAVDLAGAPLPPELARAHASVRDRVPVWIEDRLLSDDIAAVLELVRAGAFD